MISDVLLCCVLCQAVYRRGKAELSFSRGRRYHGVPQAPPVVQAIGGNTVARVFRFPGSPTYVPDYPTSEAMERRAQTERSQRTVRIGRCCVAGTVGCCLSVCVSVAPSVPCVAACQSACRSRLPVVFWRFVLPPLTVCICANVRDPLSAAEDAAAVTVCGAGAHASVHNAHVRGQLRFQHDTCHARVAVVVRCNVRRVAVGLQRCLHRNPPGPARCQRNRALAHLHGASSVSVHGCSATLLTRALRMWHCAVYAVAGHVCRRRRHVRRWRRERQLV
jgi:hypothetical protein